MFGIRWIVAAGSDLNACDGSVACGVGGFSVAADAAFWFCWWSNGVALRLCGGGGFSVATDAALVSINLHSRQTQVPLLDNLCWFLICWSWK